MCLGRVHTMPSAVIYLLKVAKQLKFQITDDKRFLLLFLRDRDGKGHLVCAAVAPPLNRTSYQAQQNSSGGALRMV